MLLGASEQGRLHLQRKWQLKQTGKGDTEWVTSNRNNHGKKAWYILKLQTSVDWCETQERGHWEKIRQESSSGPCQQTAAAKSLQSCPILCDPIDSRLPHPWDSPGKNTGVGCHFLLQCMKVKSEREDAQSCPTLRDPIDRSLPGCSVHGIFQAGVLEWGAIAFSSVLPYLLIFHFSYSIFLFSTTISSFLFYFFQFFIKL